MNIGKYEVQQGSVLFLAGENPDDHRMRWIVLSDEMGFDIEAMPVYFIPVFKISQMGKCIAKEIDELGGAVLVVIDTSAAYFEGDDENDNVQQGVMPGGCERPLPSCPEDRRSSSILTRQRMPARTTYSLGAAGRLWPNLAPT